MARIFTAESLEEWGRLHRRVEHLEAELERLRWRFSENREAYFATLKKLEHADEELSAFDEQFKLEPGYIVRPYGTGLFDGLPTLSDPELHARLRASGLPLPIVRHFEGRMRRGEFNYGLEAIRQAPEAIDRIEQLFARAFEITGTSPGDLLRHTDFHAADLGLDRLDAALAELRAVVFLHEQGFRDIRLLPGGSQAEADIVAMRAGKRYAFDVVTSHHGVDRDVEDLAPFICAKIQEKLDQLQGTANRHACQERGLIVVVNSDAAVTFGHRDSYLCAGSMSKISPAMNSPK